MIICNYSAMSAPNSESFFVVATAIPYGRLFVLCDLRMSHEMHTHDSLPEIFSLFYD